jgi:hypothetical protein
VITAPFARKLARAPPEGHADAMTIVITGNGYLDGAPLGIVSFHRTELALILGVYGRMVAAGEWRDYGISHLKDVAVFCVFRRAAEHPIYQIEKRPAMAERQGMWSVIAMDGRIEKRGRDLGQVLRVLDRKLIRAVKD